MKAKDREKAESKILNKGYKLLEPYRGERVLTIMQCPEGHCTATTLRKVVDDKGCIECSSLHRLNAVKDIFFKEGYVLQEERYNNSQERMKCLCPEGHHITVTLGSFNQGTRCVECAILKSKRNIQKAESERVKIEFEAEGYVLLDEYVKSTIPIGFICPNGHRHKMSVTSFRSGSRCLYCSKKSPITEEIVRDSFEKEGYKLLGKYVAIANKTSLNYMCSVGHTHQTSWNNWKNGYRCPHCCRTPPVSQEKVKKMFKEKGLTLLDDYTAYDVPMRFTCDYGHQHQVSWTNFLKGVECVYCNQRRINDEQRTINEIKRLISSQVRTSINHQKIRKTFSFTGFAKTIAESVHNAIGDRPEGYHLDHIIPQSFFDHRKEDELLACWDIENLRWLPARQNITRGNRLTDDEIKSLTCKQIEILNKASRIPKHMSQKLKKHGFITKPKTVAQLN